MTYSKDIIVYSLNPAIYESRKYYIQQLADMNIFKKVERIAFDYKLTERLRTIITAHIYALITAYDRNDFPLLLLEDDARLINGFPDKLDVPNECNIVYPGGSLYNPGVIANMYIEEYDSNFYRVYNMLSAHAILIMNKKGCETVINFYTNAIFKGIFNDVSLAIASKDNIFLTPKDGMYFYQEGTVENITKFQWNNVKKNLLRR